MLKRSKRKYSKVGKFPFKGETIIFRGRKYYSIWSGFAGEARQLGKDYRHGGYMVRYIKVKGRLGNILSVYVSPKPPSAR